MKCANESCDKNLTSNTPKAVIANRDGDLACNEDCLVAYDMQRVRDVIRFSPPGGMEEALERAHRPEE